MAAAGSSEQKELLALVHQHLVQIGYERAARELLAQSGQKTFLPSPVPLGDIFTQWKKTSPQAQKRKAEEIKQGSPAKIRVPDPKSSSESSEEEAAKPIKSNVAVNNSSLAKAESSSEDEESSSEEEEAAGKEVKVPAAGNKTSNLLHLAAQKTNSFPGKGVAVAAVQAKGQQKKATANKSPTQAVTKAGKNKILPVKPGSASQPLASLAAAARKTTNSESSSSSSSSESEEEKTPAAVKTPALKKAESSSGDSSDDSDSEEETNTATLQVKPAAESRQVDTTLTKSVPATAVPSKGNAVKASPAKKTAQQTRAGPGNVAKTTKPADSSETSDSSDTEMEEPSLATQAKSPGKTPQTFSSPVKNAAASGLPSTKTVSIPALLKQTPKTSAVKQPPPAKAAGGVKKAESSESSESSSESGDEAPSVPVAQKKLQTPPPPTGVRQNQIDKPGTPASALKGKEMESESSSSSSDSEDEMIPPTQDNLPPPFATKANAAPQVVSAAKSLPPPGGPLQKAQESEDSSQDSSEESDSEEDKVLTQKPAQETQKPTPAPAKAPAAKMAGATSGKAGNAQPAGKVWTASPMKSAAASLQKAAESSETDSSDSSEDEVAAGKPVKQPPIHPFFLPKAVKTAAPPGKHAQASSSTPNSVSTKCQGPAAVTTGKVKQSSSKRPKLSQTPPDKPDGILKRKESSGSSSSSDSEEEALTTAKQVPQPASIPQKQGVGGKPESSSEATSSDEDQEASQSLLKGFTGPIKTPKGAAPALSKQSSGKASSAFHSTPTSMAYGDSSSSDSSDSDADTKEIVGQKTEIGPLPSSGKEVARTKGAKGEKARKKGVGSISSKAASAKKAAAKAQSNGSTKRNPAGQLPLTLLTSTQTAPVGSEEAAAQVPGAAAQGEPQATPVAAVKPPKATKSSKAGAKEKPSKKRKLAAGDAGLGEPKGKKLKTKSDVEVPKKQKMKKKSKSATGSEKPKEKGSKKKKASKKKKKSKKLESLTADGSQKKKKKKKKTGNLEEAA
ncbi:treacle protein [Lacerta agilis]|uniref:treacle protein n=1 Tax=Lacerta agilis TaxID=80427 RepID=UPI001419FEA9|nr:treacle protein [Lacerta agilis]